MSQSAIAHAVAEIARYPRGAGGEYRVVHDRTAHQGVGVYRIYVGERQVGRQSSYPSADDCYSLERAAPAYAESSAPLPTHLNQQKPAEPKPARRSHAVARIDGVFSKRCSGCKEVKPVADFTLGTGPGGYNRYCRRCQKAWRENRKKAFNP